MLGSSNSVWGRASDACKRAPRLCCDVVFGRDRNIRDNPSGDCTTLCNLPRSRMSVGRYTSARRRAPRMRLRYFYYTVLPFVMNVERERPVHRVPSVPCTRGTDSRIAIRCDKPTLLTPTHSETRRSARSGHAQRVQTHLLPRCVPPMTSEIKTRQRGQIGPRFLRSPGLRRSLGRQCAIAASPPGPGIIMARCRRRRARPIRWLGREVCLLTFTYQPAQRPFHACTPPPRRQSPQASSPARPSSPASSAS